MESFHSGGLRGHSESRTTEARIIPKDSFATASKRVAASSDHFTSSLLHPDAPQ